MEDIVRNFLQNPLFASQLYHHQQQQQQQQQPQPPIAGFQWPDQAVNQENKKTAAVPAQRLLQESHLIDAGKMVTASNAAKPGAASSPPVAAAPPAVTGLPVPPVIQPPPAQQAATANNNGGIVLSQNPYALLQPNPWLALQHQQQQPLNDSVQNGLSANEMAEKLRMFAMGLSGVGVAAPSMSFPSGNSHMSSLQFYQQQQPQNSAPQQLPAMFPSRQNGSAFPAANSNRTAPPLASNSAAATENSHGHQQLGSGENDQLYAQFIQDNFRKNLAAATASLFSGASANNNNNNNNNNGTQHNNTMWAALIAQQMQQIHQPQETGASTQQKMVQYQNAILDQQLKKNSEAVRSPSRNSESANKQKPRTQQLTKVSTGTSPANSSETADMNSHERVHYWLYGQSLTAPLATSTSAGSERSPISTPQQVQTPVMATPQLQNHQAARQPLPQISLPPVSATTGSITAGQPVVAGVSYNLNSIAGKRSGVNSTPNSRPTSRAAQPLVAASGPDAKRPRVDSPHLVKAEPKVDSQVTPACSSFSTEERMKHYEEIVNYVIENSHLMSPPQEVPADLMNASSTPSHSNSNISVPCNNNNVNGMAKTNDSVAPTTSHGVTEVSPTISPTNAELPNSTQQMKSNNTYHSMPKKAWLQRLNESNNSSNGNNLSAVPINPVIPEGQFSPTISSVSSNIGVSKSPVNVKYLRSKSPVSPTSFYLQPASCTMAAPKITKCRECRLAQTNRPQNESCRFEGFRRLRRTSRDTILCEGFMTLADVREEDEAVWLPTIIPDDKHADVISQRALTSLTHFLANYAIGQVSSAFLSICKSELTAVYSLRSNFTSLSWRRREDKFREMCDVCQTTLFNLHWFCVKCGFVVCLECFQQRKNDTQCCKPEARRWLTCLSANRAKHEYEKLLPAVIIPPRCMQKVVDLVELCISQNQCMDGLAAVAAEATPQPKSMSSPLDILAAVASNSLVQTPAPHIPSKPSNYEKINGEQMIRFFNTLDPELPALGRDMLQRGTPFIVSNVNLKENWGPQYFCSKFTDHSVPLVNCVALSNVEHVSHDEFWKGFSSVKARVCDSKSRQPICLKMKDWPSDARFEDLLPDHFGDLMSTVPLPMYSMSGGSLNMPSYLPASFVSPDLGPKVYAAYGTGSQTRVATTALHLDIADAVNVNVHVQPLTDDGGAELKSVQEYVENSPMIAEEFKQRMRSGEVPGALWHLFDTNDADRIRTYLNQKRTSPNARDAAVRSSADPIHDQVWYIDDDMLVELRTNYNVVPFTIVQFHGDSIFIPAGCAHQVRNLVACVKVAIDFVSPERVSVCHSLTNEFRRLPDSHLNHEDKLQLKNILYQAVRGIIAVAVATNSFEKPVVTPLSPAASSLTSSDQRSPNLVIEFEQDAKEPVGNEPMSIGAAKCPVA